MAERWPNAFAVFERSRRPLKLGIRHDVIAAMAGVISHNKLKATLKVYCANVGYLRSCKKGAARIGLDGQPAGKVTASEAAQAAQIIKQRRAEQRRKKISPRPKIFSPAPPADERLRSSLADLREAARARRATRALARIGGAA